MPDKTVTTITCTVANQMTDKPQTTLEKKCAPGKTITLNGERWVVGSWHFREDERFVLMSLLMNPGITARWMWNDLTEALA